MQVVDRSWLLTSVPNPVLTPHGAAQVFEGSAKRKPHSSAYSNLVSSLQKLRWNHLVGPCRVEALVLDLDCQKHQIAEFLAELFATTAGAETAVEIAMTIAEVAEPIVAVAETTVAVAETTVAVAETVAEAAVPIVVIAETTAATVAAIEPASCAEPERRR